MDPPCAVSPAFAPIFSLLLLECRPVTRPPVQCYPSMLWVSTLLASAGTVLHQLSFPFTFESASLVYIYMFLSLLS